MVLGRASVPPARSPALLLAVRRRAKSAGERGEACARSV